MKRRTFLVSAAVLGSGAGIATWVATRASYSPAEQAVLSVAEQLADDPDVVLVGKAYLEQTDAETDQRALIEQLAESLPAVKPVDESGAGNESVIQQVQADFDEGRTVMVEGWTMSVTESQLCALAALLNSGS